MPSADGRRLLLSPGNKPEGPGRDVRWPVGWKVATRVLDHRSQGIDQIASRVVGHCSTCECFISQDHLHLLLRGALGVFPAGGSSLGGSMASFAGSPSGVGGASGLG